MDNKPLTFEVTKKELFNSAVMPLVISQLLEQLLVGGFIIYLATVGLKDIPEQDDFARPMYQTLATVYIFVALLVTYVSSILLKLTARKLVITDDLLEFTSYWQTERLRWNEIAKVDILNKGWRKYLYLKTWNGNIFILAPPLQPSETIEKEVKARALDAVGAPPRPGQRPLDERKRDLFFAELSHGFKQAFVTIFVLLSGFGVWCIWEQVRPPEIEIPHFGNFESPLALGKKMWVDGFIIHNYGQETRGIRFELSGDALDSHLLQSPAVLIDSSDRTQLSFPCRKRNQTRELVHLEHTKSGDWIGESKSTVLPHENGMVVEPMFFMTSAMSGGDPWRHELEVTLFADVLKKGKGNLKLDVTANGALTIPLKLKVATTIEDDGRATPMASVRVPSTFPLPAYPGSIIDLLSAWDIKLYSEADTKKVTEFYREELQKRGWKVTTDKIDPKMNLEANLLGRKGKDKIRVEISKDYKEGSHIEMTLNFM
jgi:hypothetical protein